MLDKKFSLHPLQWIPFNPGHSWIATLDYRSNYSRQRPVLWTKYPPFFSTVTVTDAVLIYVQFTSFSWVKTPNPLASASALSSSKAHAVFFFREKFHFWSDFLFLLSHSLGLQSVRSDTENDMALNTGKYEHFKRPGGVERCFFISFLLLASPKLT